VPRDLTVLHRELYDKAFVRLEIIIVLAEHTEPCVNEENAENINDPMKPVHKFGAGKDHYHAHKERAQYSPEQNAVLVFLRHLEIGKYQQKYKEVVDRQRQFYEIAGKKKLPFANAELP